MAILPFPFHFVVTDKYQLVVHQRRGRKGVPLNGACHSACLRSLRQETTHHTTRLVTVVRIAIPAKAKNTPTASCVEGPNATPREKAMENPNPVRSEIIRVSCTDAARFQVVSPLNRMTVSPQLATCHCGKSTGAPYRRRPSKPVSASQLSHAAAEIKPASRASMHSTTMGPRLPRPRCMEIMMTRTVATMAANAPGNMSPSTKCEN